LKKITSRYSYNGYHPKIRRAQMKKVVIGVAFAAGLLAGLFASQLLEREALAQSNWQCMSWSLDSGGNVGAVSNFLAGAKTVELTSADVSVANRFALVACRQ
jgi:hypothetical protein